MQFICDFIDEVEQIIYVVFGLVVMIIFLFLCDWWIIIILVIVIFIVFIGVFFVMYVVNFFINVFILLGIVFVIGLVVDDVVVVFENIYMKVENGMMFFEVVMKGSEEIFFVVIVIIVVLVVVFMFVIFLQGFIGCLFWEFGIVIVGVVVIFFFVVFIFMFMLLSSILKKCEWQFWFYWVIEFFFVVFIKGYCNILNGFMQVCWLVLVIMVILGWAIYIIGGGLFQELVFLEDWSCIWVFVCVLEGFIFEYMDVYINDLVEIMVKAIFESEGVIFVIFFGFGVFIFVNFVFVFVVLEDFQKWECSQMEIFNVLQFEVSEFIGVFIYFSEEQSIGNGWGGLLVQYVLQAFNFEKFKEILFCFVEKVKQDLIFSFVDVDLKFNKLEFNIEINWQKVWDLGVFVLDIVQMF